nr:hypothetical protein [uncultured Pseudomonas sp.]
MALTADRNTPMRGIGLLALAVAAGTRIYAGSLVVVDANGFAIPGKVGTGLGYAGRAEESVDNTNGAAGAVRVPVRRGEAFKWANDGTITQAQLFKTAYVVDDQTVGATDDTGKRSAAGRITGIDADGVWIE